MSYVDRIVAKNDRRIREAREAEQVANRELPTFHSSDTTTTQAICYGCGASYVSHVGRLDYCPEWALREAYGR